MGIIFSFLGKLLGIQSPMEGMKENMNYMMQKNTETMIKKQSELMLKQRQLMLAHQFAMGKDRFMFYKYFYYTASLGLLANAFKTKNPHVLGPLVPLSFVFAYQWDFYHGNKLLRVRKEAENLLDNHPELFYPAFNSGMINERDYKDNIVPK
jgi:hypothetical protein